MKAINYHAKAEHFAELASRAAYQSAVSAMAGDAETAERWNERAARYDSQAAAYRMNARRAA